MKKISIRLRITLWFCAVLVVIVALTYALVLSVSDSIMQKSIQDNLVETVENNVDEIELVSYSEYADNDNDGDQYISYGDNYLEIDDDFLDKINGITTSLYQSDGTLLYGENPISNDSTSLNFLDAKIQKEDVSGILWYTFDRELTHDGLSGLWLRGIVSAQQGTAQLSSIIRFSMVAMPLLLLLSLFGGYLVAASSLRPIKKIIETASQISHGSDLKKRIALGDGNDELHQLASSFDDMFERLDASFEMEKQFSADASHELRTPMSVIMAQCEYTLEGEASEDEYRDALMVIQRQGAKMTGLISDMLAFTRLEQRSGQIPMSLINLSESVSLLCEQMRTINDKNIALLDNIEPNVYVKGNNDLLMRLLENLVSNAYKYGRENGHVSVGLKTDAEYVVLSVEDDGIGIAPEDRERIFNRFYQVDCARSNSGAGLGLSMVREIARLHGASVSVESELNRGSIFVCKLKNF